VLLTGRRRSMLNAHGDSGDGMGRLAVSSPGCDDAW
jgi:hypothetical protein